MAVTGVNLSAALYLTWLLFLVHSVSALKDIKAELGKDTILPCQAPKGDLILVVEWTRGDLKSEYVFLYRDGHSDTDNQNPGFKDRVELVDGEMKNGNLSVRLKNVTINDSGTYECHVIQSRANRRKRSSFDTEPINIIRLDVEGQTTENTEGGHLGIILPVAALIVVVVVAVVGFVIFKKSTGRFPVQSVDDPDVHQQLQEKENSQSKTITLNISDIQV